MPNTGEDKGQNRSTVCHFDDNLGVHASGQGIIDKPAHQRPALACHQAVTAQFLALDGFSRPEGVGLRINDQDQGLAVQFKHLDSRNADPGG